MVLVGAVCAGKTTLVRGLRKGEPAPTAESERTRGVDVHIQPWRPNSTEPLEVLMWDFAGHSEYYSTHQIYLTSGALQLLVVDLLKFQNDISHRGEAVYTWLDVLLCRLPGCAVLVVATHADGFSGDNAQVEAALSFLEEEVRTHLELKRKELRTEKPPRLTIEQRPDSTVQTAPSLTVCGVVEASGCSKEGLDRLRDEICRLAGEGGLDEDGQRLFPNVGQKIPVSWRRVWAFAAALHEGGEPAVAVQSYGEPVKPVDGYATHNFVTEEFALATWSTVVQQLGLEAELKGRTSERRDGRRGKRDALNMRQTGGTLLFACGLVHLDPSWINLLLRELLDHRLAEVALTEQWHCEVDEHCRSVNLHFDELVDSHRIFLKTGRLSKDYLRFLWRDVPDLDETVLGRMIDTMSTYGAMFPCGPTGEEASEFVVPARLPCLVADVTLSDLEKAISDGFGMQFTFEIRAKYVPPGIIAQFVGRFCRGNNIIFRACWSKGVSFILRGREHLICLHEPTKTLSHARIEVTVAGDDKATVWDPAFNAKEALTSLLHHEYGGLRFVPPNDPIIKEGKDAWQDTLDGLQEHLQSWINKNLEKVLDKMMAACQPPEANPWESESAILNRIDATLVRRLHELRLDVERDVHQRLEKNVDTLLNTVGAKIDRLTTGGLGDSERGMLRNVAFDIAYLRWPVPRLACLLPAHEGALSEVARSYSSWSVRLQRWCHGGRVDGKGIFSRKLRLFLLCAHDMSLVKCGPGGQGYEVKELLAWVRKAKVAAKVGFVLGSIALKVCTGLAVPADQIDSAFGEALGGVVSKIVEEGANNVAEEVKCRALESLSGDDDADQLSSLDPARTASSLPLDGFIYEQLRDTVKGFEVEGYKTKKPDSSFHSFSSEMQLVDRGGRGVEWAWVRRRNFKTFVGDK
ncbi:unnamed protein product [Sphacelaria rigidula]